MTQRNSNDRVCARPDPAAWRDDELMTLTEAAALFWPDGPLTETSLRTAVRDHRLAISQIAGKFFTTKRAIAALEICKTLPSGQDGEHRRGDYHRDLRKIASMGRSVRK
ncbi:MULTISPECIES: hypothetical protein [Bradyrhizobium]|uniref:hypothetical protein n=1 Tax=Bradyrhizobium TaxID=374 RepID=UPI000484E4F0|nr:MULTISPECIES: hypothetical protein [Bradyrhizobium]UFW46278.1 hypothetical protein BaraCB756_28665 [Bradyrhizobium arachidis]